MAGVLDATEASIAAATHLTVMDGGAVAALREMARKVDEMEFSDKFDNTTLPTYLKYCSELGLTPAGRKALQDGKPKEEAKRESSIAKRRAAANHLRSAS